MKTINLFIACSTRTESLNEQKEALVNICKSLNTEYARKKEVVRIRPVAYDNLERRQQVFDNYIKSKADIVVFLIDKKYGSFLEDELNLAVKRLRRWHKPELLVFLSEELDKGSEQKIKKILEKCGQLIDPLKDTDSLIASVKARIEGFVESYKEIRRRQRWNKIIRWALPVLLVTIYVLIRVINYYSQPRILLVGGGSVKTYILNECGVDIIREKPRFWMYAPMPSSNSWTLLTEEAMKDEKDRKYYPICLSAEEAVDSVFLGKMDSLYFKKKGVVVSILVGYDTLTAYCRSSYFNNYLPIDVSVINSNSLVQLISDKNVRLYATSPGSGTLDTYNEKATLKLPSNDTLFDGRRIFLFKDIDYIDSNWGNYIILGSKNYLPNDPTKSGRTLFVLDSDGNAIRKPIFLYFMAYSKKGEFVIEKEILNFFEKINRPISKEFVTKVKYTKEYIVKDTIL